MQINKVTGVSASQQTSFGAQIPKALREELFYAANNKGHEACDAFFKQAKKVEEWGHETCSLTKLETKTREGREYSLALIDSYVAPFQEVKLPKKPTLLDSFMALTERIVVDAENKFNL